MPFDPPQLTEALQLLGRLLAVRRAGDFWLVVCGGSALLARQIVARPTRDVDILALRDVEGGISHAYPLPETLTGAVREVADELRLDPNWLNSATSLHFPDLGSLPQSFWQELDTRDFGDHLRVSFVTRSGQILLKCYAALNRAEARDFDDLAALAPDERESEQALRWLLDSFPGLTHLDRLPELLTHLGHAPLIPRFKG